MKKTKRFLSILLVLCMLLGLLPTTVFAAGTSITSYADVQETDWFYDAVKYASENGMMNGTGGGLFSPSMVTNRAMIVTILYRLEGEPEVTGATSFSDVAAGQWYTDAILWAAQKGVVTGYDTGLFGPDDAITREQMATILYRYAQYKEYDTTASGDVTTFTDGSSVSAYAVEAVKWAVGVGLLTGTDKGALLPTGSASRAEVATILMRFCQGFEVELPGDDTPLSGRPSGSGGSGSGGSGSGGSSSDDMSGVPEAPELPEVDGDMTVGASTDPNASAAREEANAAISQWAATQGMVLLENNNNVLPISGNAGTPVALFGVGAYNTIKGGTGSGDVYLKDGANINVRQGFEDYGYTIVNADFLDEQEALYEENGTGGGGMWGSAVYKEPAYDAEKVNAIEGTDTAIYVLARNSGEGSDRKLEGGDYYLTDEEAYNLTLLGQKFENVIVVINAGGIIDTNFFNGKGGYDADDACNRGQIEGLDALVLMSQAGQNGGYALVEVLNRTVTPSGKLTDTCAINYEDYPSAEGFSYLDGNTYEEYYTDDIYVGYRYFDTFGVDVAYPFGYGGSYTSFTIDVTDVTASADKVTVTADVTNTGSVTGQEVVEVYFSAPAGSIDKPYQELAGYKKVEVEPGETRTVKISFDTADMSSYDESSDEYVLEAGKYIIRVGNSSRNTVQAATINLNADVVTEICTNLLGLTKDDMQAGTYDADAGYILNYEDPATHKNPTYEPMELDMLDENSEGYGDYITPTEEGLSASKVSVSLDASDFPAPVTYDYSEGSITTYVSSDETKDSAKYADGKTASDGETFEVVDAVENATLMDVVNGKITMEQLVASMSNVELADLVEGGTYDGFTEGSDDVEAVVGSQAESVYGAAGETTSNLYTTRYIPNIVMSDGPAGIRITNSYVKYDMVPGSATFDPDQTYYTASYSWGGTNYTEIEFADAEAFEAERAKGTVLYTTTGDTYYQYCTAFPIGTLLAQTWDPEVIEAVGRAVGVEMKEYGVTSWLAPGMNIHRNPLCGRNFEYYSEDPLVAGLTAAAETRGVETNEDGSASGVGVTLKHFAFNSQENSRMGSNSVVSERAAREIYLKGFEIAVREAKPDYIMSSYNMVNGYPTFEHYNLLTEILRNEWGFDGFVMTDWYSIGAVYGQNAGQNVQGWLNYAGNDCEMPGGNVSLVLDALADDSSVMRLGDLQRSAMAMLNVIQYTQAFELTLNKIILNSNDADQVAAAWNAKQVLAEAKAG